MLTRITITATAVIFGCLALFLVEPASSQDTSVKPGINKNFENPALEAKDWVERFEREGRETYDKRKEILGACCVKPGSSVADVGAGTGLFTRMFAEKVGSEGRVFAVDIAQPFVEDILRRAQDLDLENITGVVCLPDDPRLQPESVDVIFICDTYHHFEFPYKTMASLHRSLRPEGRLVVVDFERIEGKSSDWILGHVRAGKEVVTKEIEVSGFDLVKEEKILDSSYVLIFRKGSRGAK